MAGLTSLGFESKRLPEIKTDAENGFRTSFGENIQLTDNSILGQQIGILSLQMAQLWDLGQNIFLSQSPDYAEGVQLDNVVALNGVQRLPATKTKINAILMGTPSTVIVSGKQAKTIEGDFIFTLKNNVTLTAGTGNRILIDVGTLADSTNYTVTINGTAYTIDSGTSATNYSILLALKTAIDNAAIATTCTIVNDQLCIYSNTAATTFTYALSANLNLVSLGYVGEFEALETGNIVLNSGDLATILTPVNGWDGIFTPYAADVGSEMETDVELRARRKLSVAIASSSNYDAIFSRILALPDVDDVELYVNSGTTTDANSIPPQHIKAYVLGGSNADIADVLSKTLPVGIGMVGNITVNVNAVNGQAIAYKFNRPTLTPVYIDLTITADNNFPDAGEIDIKNNLVQYFSDAIRIGDDVLVSRLYSDINKTQGFYVTALTLGTSPSPAGTSNLTAAVGQRFTLIADNINITVN